MQAELIKKSTDFQDAELKKLETDLKQKLDEALRIKNTEILQKELLLKAQFSQQQADNVRQLEGHFKQQEQALMQELEHKFVKKQEEL